MIYLPDVAKKLEDILNSANLNQIVNPNGYLYKVATTGFHLDHNYSIPEGKNFIPVFIDTMGGNYDAVQHIKRSVKNIPVVIYFPVRFKNDFFAIDEFLVDTFVAKIVDFGGITGKGLCNISVTQYGEIQDFDLKNFSTWVETFYKKSISVTEPYMSMTFTIYITTQSEEFVLGNSVKYRLSYGITNKVPSYITLRHVSTEIPIIPNYERGSRPGSRIYEGETYYEWYPHLPFQNPPYTVVYTKKLVPEVGDEVYRFPISGEPTVIDDVDIDVVSSTMVDKIETHSEYLVWTSSGTGLSNSPISQQLIDVDDYAKNVINITNYNKSIVAYIRNNEFWMLFLDYYNRQDMKELSNVTLTKIYDFGSFTKSYNYNQLVLAMNENVSLGDLLSMTITFGDKYVEDNE